MRENHNGYLASLDGKKIGREIKDAVEEQAATHAQQLGKRITALELQQASLCQVVGKFISSLQAILPEEVTKVICGAQAMHFHCFDLAFVSH